MADKTKSRNSSRNASRPGSQSLRRSQNAPEGASKQNQLLSREEEYKRLNAELEKRTASLVMEAEAVINQQEFSSPRGASRSLLDNVNSADLLDDWDSDGTGEEVTKPKKQINSKVPSASSRRPPKPSAVSRSRSNVGVSAGDILTDYNDLDIQSAVDEMESKVSETDDVPEDVLPAAAQEMGSEAQIRFLKAKARVMQEELDRLSSELAQQKEEANKLTSRAKDLEDERNKLARSNASQLTSLEKYKKSAEDARGKTESLESQLTALRKECEALKRSQKQQLSTQSTVDVRLNRALEEIEKYKLQLSKAKDSSKSSASADKQRIEKLLAENKKLEKQKSELMTGFKKQMKLIDILKRQKMHIEAAKMLAFTEEEFVKALEWGS